MNSSQSKIKSIIQKWKDYGITAHLPKRGCLPKLKGWVWRAFTRGSTKRATVILEELQRFTGQLLVMYSTNLFFMEECHEESHCWKKAIGIPVCSYSWATLETQQTYRRRWSDEIKIEHSYFKAKGYIWWKPYTACTAPWAYHPPQWNMLVIASCYGGYFSSTGTSKLVRSGEMMNG